MTPDQTAPQDRVAGVTSAAVVSLLGLCLHNVADLDDQYPWSIETLGPAAFLAACLLLWRLLPRFGAALLLAWELPNLLGGAVLSVLPAAAPAFRAGAEPAPLQLSPSVRADVGAAHRGGPDSNSRPADDPIDAT